jgi:FKBP-type peptidyl-prolyl cis-trans isomerase SlyD
MSARHLGFHFTLRDADGRVLDTSRGGEPVTCLEGGGQIIDGLEAALRTMAAGEQRTVVVPPERGYGVRDAALVQRVPRAHLPVGDLKPGDTFQTEPDPQAPVVTVVALEGEAVLLDANHPLAGRELHFEVELVTVRQATEAELQRAQNPS